MHLQFLICLLNFTGDKRYIQQKDQTLKWLKDTVYSMEEKRMNRGKGDATIATDTMAWAIAAIGPKILLKNSMDPDAMIKFAEDHCAVKVKFKRSDGKTVNVSGFDFSKAQNLARGGIVSPEWTAQMIVTYYIMADYYTTLNDNAKADQFRKKGEYYLNNLDKMVISSPSKSGQGAGCLPYASSPNADTGHGWRTPKGKDTGSVAGTGYTLFAHKDFNPLAFE